MTRAPLRVLITGFGPFPGILENSSEAFAPLLAYRARERFQHLQTACAILPTQWAGAPFVLQRLLAELQPHICLHFGVQGGATGLVLETIARNRTSDRLDAAGLPPDGDTLVAGAPSILLPSAGPRRLLGDAIKQGLPVAASVNAGDYVCNALFYHSLLAARRIRVETGPARLVAFVHVPVRVGGAGLAEEDDLNVNNLTLDAALSGSLSILGAMAEHYSSGLTQIGTRLAAAE
jgi:pyroglutamyl-peptidase